MEGFLGLAVVLVAAAVGGVVTRLFRQPAILGYVLAGALVAGWGGYGRIETLLEMMGSLGVTLLLFLVGLELPIEEVKKMGRVALATGLGQIVFTAAVGYVIIRSLGFGPVASGYLAVALAFSSTIIIVKLLSEKRDLASLYGRIAVGFLLVQDFVAIGILVALSGLRDGGWSGLGWGMVAIKGVVLVAAAMWLSARVLPGVVRWMSASSELLFVGSMAWCLAVAAVVASPIVNFGVEIGGFLAGLAVANSGQSLQILARTRPLRDFFLTLFFVWLGGNISLGSMGDLWWPAAVLSVFVLVGNPLIVMVILGVMGYRKRTSFLAGLTVAQISEFSLIVMAVALRVGHVGEEALALTTIVGVVTMTVSTYMILNGDRLYRVLAPVLGVFERKKTVEGEKYGRNEHKAEVILFGLGRTGSALVEALARLGRVVVVDFDPRVVEGLKSGVVAGCYGDMGDYELYDELGVGRVNLVVSTVPSVEDNLTLLEYLGGKLRRPMAVVVAVDEADAARLYRAGADYVLVPNRVGGEYLAHIFNQYGKNWEYIRKQGENQRKRLMA